MASTIYPAIIERAKTGYSVFFPDLPGCVSAGRTEVEAFVNAEEALSLHLSEMIRDQDDLPRASDLHDLERDPDVDEVGRVLVRAELPGKIVRLNITLDEALVARIDRVAKNRSGFLAEAARDRLAELADA